jgi:trk system potassium uptake protein TrkA
VTAPRQTVVTSCGGLGATVAAALAEKGHVVTVLDPRSEAFDRLPRDLVQQERIIAVVGDAKRHEDLRRASVRDADAVMALSSNDSENALVGQLAKHVYHVPTVVCRIDDPTMQGMYTRLGLDAISGTALVARAVLEAGT